MRKAVIFDMYETLITHFQSPLYFGTQMAIDAGITQDRFKELWEPTEKDRTIGKMTLERALETVLKGNRRYSKELLDRMVQKRIQVKEACFDHMHEEIIPLLRSLKTKGIMVGLISNCFSEEADVIRKSVLFQYFDAICLSYEQGVQKPDAEIYRRCMEQLHVEAGECLYVGDGGSFELEAAQAIGMKAVQAVWYLQDGTSQPCGRKDGFEQIENPMEILNKI